jgi:hypothetical protein
MKYFFFIPILLFHLTGFSQDSTIAIEKFIITKSKHNGEDMSKFEIDRGGELVFEIVGHRPLRFINNSRIDSTASFGSIKDFKTDSISMSGALIFEIRSSFIWDFKNDYDNDSGIANISFLQKHTNYSVDFYLKMTLPKTGERLEYWGYKQGTRDEFLLSETVF